jgi:F0F1-type ATP synthase membrane subunit c/vacuolar-type H+-ATPase subunit K
MGIEQAIVSALRPHQLPAEQIRCAAFVSTFRTQANRVAAIAAQRMGRGGGVVGAVAGFAASSAIEGRIDYWYLVCTTERVYFLSHGEAERPSEKIGAVDAIELAEIAGVQGGVDGLDWVSLMVGGQERKVSIEDCPELTAQREVKSAFFPWLHQSIQSGSLRTPERVARIQQRDARLAAERASRAAAAEVARDAHVRATIARQPENKFRELVVLAGIAAAAGIFGLVKFYETLQDIGAIFDRTTMLARAVSAKNAFESKRVEGLLGESTGSAIVNGLVALVCVAVAVGAGLFARKTFRVFKEQNRELRAKYGLPAA